MFGISVYELLVFPILAYLYFLDVACSILVPFWLIPDNAYPAKRWLVDVLPVLDWPYNPIPYSIN